ncbi:MAG: polysaccharide deacetylase family protein [Clostridiales bacterium]|nr:polysaccharide deacetylase family protein [Clostridiales bacterium]
MTEQKKAVSKRRVKRIRRLKKIIILSILAGILIPTILCVYLFIRVVQLENKVDELYEARTVIETEESTAVQQLSGVPEENEAMSHADILLQESDGQTDSNAVQAGKAENEADGSDALAVETQEMIKEVHLTFDDGPSVMTDDILDILKEYDVKATFFVNGREDEQSLAMYRRIVEEGHTLGMHSYTHRYGEVYASKEAFIEDTLRLQTLLWETTGEKPMLYRFPGGSSNHVKGGTSMDDLIDWLDEQGIVFFDWNISSGDSSAGGLSVQQIVSNCTNTIPNHEEPVILMHDSGAKKTTVEALPLVIEKIQAMDGVEITAITEETEPVHHNR